MKALMPILCLMLAAPAVHAQESSTQPAPASRPAAEMAEGTTFTAKVIDARGLVEVRSAPDQPWLAVEVGMVVNEGAEFRTGPRSSVTCFVEPGQTFTLDRLGTVMLVEAMKSNGKVHTELMMKYGRTALQVEAAGVEHDSKIRSPSSTLAVRGTTVALFDQPPYMPEAVSFTGRAAYRSANREVSLGGKREARIRGEGSDAAQTAIDASVVDPQLAAARTSSDARFIANETSRGALIGFDPVAQIQTLRGGAGPILDDALFASTLPGQFQITIRWTGNADLNLLATHQTGDALDILAEGYLPTEILFPGYGLDRSVSGGKIPFDHKGGKNGGTEIAFWTRTPSEGMYGLSAQHTSGEAATVRMTTYFNGQRVNIYNITDEGDFVKGRTLTRTVEPGGTVSSIFPFPAFPPEVEGIIPDDDDPGMEISRRRRR